MLGEALVIIVRFIDKDWNIQQRLLKLEIIAKSMNAEEPAQRLIQCLAVEYGMQPNPLAELFFFSSLVCLILY